MLVDYIISRISNSMIREVILIGDNITLLDYGHQFIWSLHVVDSRSWTPIVILDLSNISNANFFKIDILGLSTNL